MDKKPIDKHLAKKPNLSDMSVREKIKYWASRIRLRVRFYWRKVLPPVTKERVSEVQVQLRDSSTPDFDYFVMVLLSCMIATFGLLIDSAATIIGAMLVAPLMSPILGIGLASIRGDTNLLRDATSALFRGALLAVLLSALITWTNDLLPFVSMQDLPGEVLSRTRPSPIDLGVALAGGLAATFALVQPNLSAALPGVAIATALMPPLCVIGVGLASGDWEVAEGATLLFFTNAITIAASSTFLFYVTGFSLGRKAEGRRLPRSLQLSILLIVILLAPLGWQSYRFVQEASFTREIELVVEEEVENFGAELESLSWQERADEVLVMDITVLVSDPLRHSNSIELQNAIAGRLQRTVQLRISQVYAAQLDPLVPPTLTPTLRFSPTPTLTPTNTPTIIITDTPTPTPTNTPTQTPTMTFTPTPQTGIIRNEEYRVEILAFPNGPSIGYIYRNQPFEVLYDSQILDGWVWIEVKDQEGRIGWIPQFRFQIVTKTPTPTP